MRTMTSALVLLALVAPTAARATPNFPAAIAQDLGAPQPPCSICHAGGMTGYGTVTTPFGQAMKARGLVAGDQTSLKTALDRMRTDKVDSNGNGILDVDELIAGNDPNAIAGQQNVTYGCSVSPRSSFRVPVLLVALSLCSLFFRLRRRSISR